MGMIPTMKIRFTGVATYFGSRQVWTRLVVAHEERRSRATVDAQARRIDFMEVPSDRVGQNCRES